MTFQQRGCGMQILEWCFFGALTHENQFTCMLKTKETTTHLGFAALISCCTHDNHHTDLRHAGVGPQTCHRTVGMFSEKVENVIRNDRLTMRFVSSCMCNVQQDTASSCYVCTGFEEPELQPEHQAVFDY